MAPGAIAKTGILCSTHVVRFGKIRSPPQCKEPPGRNPGSKFGGAISSCDGWMGVRVSSLRAGEDGALRIDGWFSCGVSGHSARGQSGARAERRRWGQAQTSPGTQGQTHWSGDCSCLLCAPRVFSVVDGHHLHQPRLSLQYLGLWLSACGLARVKHNVSRGARNMCLCRALQMRARDETFRKVLSYSTCT